MALNLPGRRFDEFRTLSESLRKIQDASSQVRFNCQQCRFLVRKCLEIDGLAWRLGFRSEERAPAIFKELIIILGKVLLLLRRCSWDSSSQGHSSAFEDAHEDLNNWLYLISEGGAEVLPVLQHIIEEENLMQQKSAEEDAHGQSIDSEEDLPFIPFDEIERQNHIGNGAFGEVWKAVWNKQPVAVKVFQKDEGTFETEKKAFASFRDPNQHILRAIGFSEHDGKNVLVLELMKMDLKKLLSLEVVHFPLLLNIHIMIQIARAMRFLHENNVIHRDLKPQNVLVDFLVDRPENILETDYVLIKLTDFGISKTEFKTCNLDNITMVGTPMYMAPEINGLSAYTRKIDVYSFACTCSEILTGTPPFPGASRPCLPQGLPSDLALLICNCWEDDEAKRPSFKEVVSSLLKIKMQHLHHCSSTPSQFVTASESSNSSSPSSDLFISYVSAKIFRLKIEGNPVIGGTLSIKWDLSYDTASCNCRWSRIDHTTRHEEHMEMKLVPAATPEILDYTITAEDFGKVLVLHCVPIDNDLKSGAMRKEAANHGNPIQCDITTMEKIRRWQSNGQARFSICRPKRTWLDGKGELLINPRDHFICWKTGSSLNSRVNFPSTIQISRDNRLLCTLATDDRESKFIFNNRVDRDLAILTSKYFQQAFSGGSLEGF